MKKHIISFALIMALAAGCGESYFEDVPIHSAHEFLTRESRGEELIFAINNAGISSAALIAGSPEAPVDDSFPDPGAPENMNDLVLKAGETLPGRLIPFIFVPGDEPNPVEYFESYHNKRARGLALWRVGNKGERPLSDPQLEALYRYAEINGVPVFVSITPPYIDELSAVLSDHVELKVIAGSLLGLQGDLPRLLKFLEYHPNLFVDIGFDAEPGFLKNFDTLTNNEEILNSFFDRMKDRILFAGGLLFDHRLSRKGLWGMQIFKVYRSFLEKTGANMRVPDANGYWQMMHIPGLGLKKERLEKIYHNNFMKILGATFHDPLPSEFDSLIIKTPDKWRFDPVSPTRLIAALTAPPEKLVTMISTQRLRDIFAGKLTDWREINGEPGPIRLASYGPLVQIAADQLDAPLLANVTIFDDPAKLREAVYKSGDMLGIIPFGDLNGRLAVLSVDGDNPCVSNVKYCASKAAPTIANYFSTYPLLIPIAWPADQSVEKFDPFEIRTIFIGGQITATEPDLQLVKPHILPDGTPDIQATRMKPIYEILPHIRRNDFTVFADGDINSYEAFLMRCLGTRSLVSEISISPFGFTSEKTPTLRVDNSIRGMPIRLTSNVKEISDEGLTVLMLPGDDPDAIRRGISDGANVVISESGLQAVRGIGLLKAPLGSFYGEDNSSGAYAILSYYSHQLCNIEIVPTHTTQGEVQRRFGSEARSFLLSTFSKQ